MTSLINTELVPALTAAAGLLLAAALVAECGGRQYGQSRHRSSRASSLPAVPVMPFMASGATTVSGGAGARAGEGMRHAHGDLA